MTIVYRCFYKARFILVLFGKRAGGECPSLFGRVIANEYSIVYSLIKVGGINRLVSMKGSHGNEIRIGGLSGINKNQ